MNIQMNQWSALLLTSGALALSALSGCGGGGGGIVNPTPTPGPTPPPTTQPPVAQNVLLTEATFFDVGNSEIYTVRPDGKGRVRLTNSHGEDITPTYSPDGRTIAFASNRNGGLYKLFLMGSDGSNVRPLTSGSGNDRFPSFSPDGTKLAFASDRDAASAMSAKLAAPSAAVLAARRRLAQRMNSNGRTPRTIASLSGKPEDIYLLTIASGAVQRLTTDPAGDTSPDFSPDGRRIVFESDRGTDRDEDVYIIDANGQNQTQVTSDGALEKNPRWSPDGSRIAFSASRVSEVDRDGLYTIKPDGSQPFLVRGANAVTQTFSPDGQKLAAKGGTDVIVNVDGTAAMGLTDEQGAHLTDFLWDWR